ncbi:unnamed protein product [Urochloa humidicola]
MPRDPDPMAEASAGSGRMVPWSCPQRTLLGWRTGSTTSRANVCHRKSAAIILDARQLVQTCVLPQRWRDLWRDVRRISASRREFEIKNDVDYDARDPLFKKLANPLLLLRSVWMQISMD